MTVTAVRHPAKFSDALLPVLARALDGRRRVLDPVGGVGKLGHIKRHGFTGYVCINEIEPEWAAQAKANGVDKVTIGDARKLPYADEIMDAICTSPVYGNKLSEHCDWKPDRKCITYKSYLGRALHERNAGRYYFWEREYADIHWPAWMEAVRVLAPGGLFVLNASKFIRAGQEQDVTGWHVGVLEALGLVVIERHQVETPRQRFGKNADKRVSHEDIVVLRKPGGAA